MALTREQLLALATTRRKEKVHLSGHGDVYVRTITAGERERWENLFVGKAARPALVRPMLVAMAACDEDGRPLFTEDDVQAVAGLPITVVEPLFDAAVKLNQVSAADVDALEGESEAGRANGSLVSSPAT